MLAEFEGVSSSWLWPRRPKGQGDKNSFMPGEQSPAYLSVCLLPRTPMFIGRARVGALAGLEVATGTLQWDSRNSWMLRSLFIGVTLAFHNLCLRKCEKKFICVTQWTSKQMNKNSSMPGMQSPANLSISLSPCTRMFIGKTRIC